MTEPKPISLLERRERYLVFASIASGGMASVHLGVARGALGFSRIVAIKRLHPQFARNERFVNMLLEEARLAARVRHVNVVQTHDIIEKDGEVFVVMEYVRGLSLAALASLQGRQGHPLPSQLLAPILAGALRGLHAAHEATDWDGRPLGLVHRDVSPQNIIVGLGGLPRVLDFGFAQAIGRGDVGPTDEFKGKLAYAAPEQLTGGVITRKTDVYAAGIVLWELLAGARLFLGETDAETFSNALRRPVCDPLDHRAEDRAEEGRRDALRPYAAIALRALERDPAGRFETALEMASALDAAGLAASQAELGRWVERLGAEPLAREDALLREVERQVAAFATDAGARATES